MSNYTLNPFMTQPIHLPPLAMAKPIKPNKSYNTPYMPRIQQFFFFGYNSEISIERNKANTTQ